MAAFVLGLSLHRDSPFYLIVAEKSMFTFQQALNAQMARGMPPKSYS